jgi:hypothetical protein
MKKKPYWEMKPEELAKATRQFDEPFVIDRSRPLNPAEKAEWKKAKKKRGRPKKGQGFQRISVSMERGLLKRVTAMAHKRRISRSKLFAEVFERTLQKE